MKSSLMFKKIWASYQIVKCMFTSRECKLIMALMSIKYCKSVSVCAFYIQAQTKACLCVSKQSDANYVPHCLHNSVIDAYIRNATSQLKLKNRKLQEIKENANI